MADQVIKTQHVTFRIFTAQRDRMLLAPDGELGQFTKGVAERVLDASKNHIGTTYSGVHPGRRLRSSGRVVRSPIGGSAYDVRFEHRAAVYHYTGTRPHLQDARVKISNTVGFRFIHRHPGTQPNRYIEKGAREVGLTISQRPTGFARTGFARIPRGFA